MYGYIVMNKPELKIREYDRYRAYYCGLCKALKADAGMRGQISLSYDMTFLALLLSALYEPETQEIKEHCMVHPIGRQTVLDNACIAYVADMSLLLTWYKCKDDYADEKKVSKALYGATISGKVRQIEKQYDRQAEVIRQQLLRLSEFEKERVDNIDQLSACFGTLLGEVFVMRKDEWESCLRSLGFYIGKFVYIMDAYDDLERDVKKGCFNPLAGRQQDEDLNSWVHQLLVMAASEFAKAFERLPIVEDAGILRNIIYSGVFCKYTAIQKQKDREMEAQHEKSI